MKKYLTKNNILYFLGVLITGVLIALVIRVTYAYMAPTFEDAYKNVSLESDKVDEFKFEGGAPLTLEATSTTLPEGGGNILKTSTAKAKLKASPTRTKTPETDDDTASFPYFVYINIPNNSFTYIKDTNPEILFQVSVDGVEITNITGLTYGTFNGISGFDVTTVKGDYLITQKTITSTSSTEFSEQNWEFKLIYLNQNYDQSANYSNTMNIEISMQKEDKTVVATAKYWNDEFGNNSYTFPNTPSLTYPSIAALQTGYANFASRPYYIKTTETEHQACLYYNSKEFCLNQNYWLGDAQDGVDGSSTKAKLKTDMEDALGITIADSSCHSDSSLAYCFVSSFACSTRSNGIVDCYDAAGSCNLSVGGDATCH